MGNTDERRGKMRRNNVRRYITRGGQVIQAVMANGGDEAPAPPRNAPPGANPPGQAGANGGMNASRLVTFMIMAFVSILLLILAVGVIRRVGEWAFSGDKNTGIVAVEESAPAEIDKTGSNLETEYFQKPIVPQTPSRVAVHHNAAEDEADEVSQTEAVPYEPPQLADEKPLYQAESRQRKTSALVSRKPAVDYQASVREMETVFETRRSEIQRITAGLRDIGRSGEDDW